MNTNQAKNAALIAALKVKQKAKLGQVLACVDETKELYEFTSLGKAIISGDLTLYEYLDQREAHYKAVIKSLTETYTEKVNEIVATTNTLKKRVEELAAEVEK